MSKNKSTVEEILNALAGVYSKKQCEEILKHARVGDIDEAQKCLDKPRKRKTRR